MLVRRRHLRNPINSLLNILVRVNIPTRSAHPSSFLPAMPLTVLISFDAHLPHQASAGFCATSPTRDTVSCLFTHQALQANAPPPRTASLSLANCRIYPRILFHPGTFPANGSLLGEIGEVVIALTRRSRSPLPQHLARP